MRKRTAVLGVMHLKRDRMKPNNVVEIMLVLLFLHGMYLSIFCGWSFFVVPVTYIALAYGIYKRNMVARYIALIVLFMHCVINISTLGFVYYPVSEAELMGVNQVFELEFDEARFLFEIIPPTIITVVTFITLWLPSVVRGYRNSA